jgi:hypothetical protein
VGYQAGYSQTSPASGKNAYFGYQAGYANVTSDFNTYIGNFAGGNATSSNNTFVGSGAGYLVTSGAKNSIFGNYNGNQGSLDIRTASNYIVLSDGDGNPLISTNSTRSVALNGATPQTGTGITFPATQSASSDANTLDDYEEGAWSPTLTSAGGNFTTLAYGDQQGTYTRIGREVTVRGNLYTSGAITAGSASGQVYIAGLPFAASVSNLGQIWTSPDTANYNSPLALATGVQVNSSTLRMYKNGTVNNSNFNVTDLYTVGGPSNNIYFQATYFV